jgi:hypothetical protein
MYVCVCIHILYGHIYVYVCMYIIYQIIFIYVHIYAGICCIQLC